MAEVQSIENILEKHRRERKDLQAKIQSLKHSAAKGDKKKKKEISVKIAELDAELTVRHDNELLEFQSTFSQLQDECSGVNDGHSIVDESYKKPPPRISKAQKRRDKKASKEKEREDLILEQEIINLNGARFKESQKLDDILLARGLSIYEVPSDGDCLYKAIEHQLSTLNLQNTTVKQLRQETSDYMLSHRNDFIPFLVGSQGGGVMSHEQYEKYCIDIVNKPAWGGQLEIEALSHVCSAAIEVVQADGPSIITGLNYSTAKLILSYHRHMYGLGEHYNSVIEKVEINEDF